MRRSPGRPAPRNVRRMLLLSGTAVFLFCLVIIAFTIRNAREVTRLSEEVRLHYRPLAVTAYQLETNVFELGAAAVTYLAQRDAADLSRVTESRGAMLRRLERYEQLAAMPPRVSAEDAQARLRQSALEYIALADSIVDAVRRAPAAGGRENEKRTLQAFTRVQRTLDDLLDREIQPQAVRNWIVAANLARDGIRRTAWIVILLAPLTLLIAAYAAQSTVRAYVRTQRLHEQAQHVSQQKTEFASITAHELRSPLTAILGSMRLMKSGRAGELPATAIPYIEMASRNAVRLLALINELLELDRIEAGMMPFKNELVSCDAMVRGSCEALAAMAVELGVNIDANSHTRAKVRGDPDRLQQVLVNLLSNALKHAPRDTTVLVRADDAGANVRFSVRDFGPGIEPADRDRIFQRFVQTGPVTQHASTGLGLTIAREIVRRQGGEIGVESVVGEGATFWFELPRAAS